MTYNFKQKVSDGEGSDMSKRQRLVSWEMFRALCPVNFLYKAPSFNLTLTWIVGSELYKLYNFTKINA